MSSENPHSQAYLEANKGPAILGIVLTVSILSTVFVFGRVFTRKRIIGALHLDDWFTIIAMIFQWCQVAVTIVAVRDGNGRHFDTLTMSQQQNAIFFTILGFPFGVMAFGFPKLAVVALITRLMNPRRVHRIFLWTLAGCCMLSLVGCIIILFAQCSPVESQWDFSITDKSCWSPYILIDYAIFSGALSAATDLYLAIYPAVVLYSLQMNKRRKIALSCALGIGSTATIVAIYKCTRLPSLASPDFSYDTSDLVIWTIIEASTIIIASCIPVLQPLVDAILGRRAFGSSPGYKNYKSSGYQSYGNSGTCKIELSDNRQGRSASQVDTTNLKYLGSGAAEIDSQESILRHEGTKARDVASRDE
ncbi:related to integral membrane protein PTH11 [Fusarium torulosum]|uniref:Related to integral membrane protein PTH11 n=1 Tax=Fusarium torulosum TaxID=33205 RepID=A0AAE8LXU5_9HYPO|nr:related to integral membrane protein PTH11 [Fusarium torulosum]